MNSLPMRGTQRRLVDAECEKVGVLSLKKLVTDKVVYVSKTSSLELRQETEKCSPRGWQFSLSLAYSMSRRSQLRASFGFGGPTV